MHIHVWVFANTCLKCQTVATSLTSRVEGCVWTPERAGVIETSSLKAGRECALWISIYWSLIRGDRIRSLTRAKVPFQEQGKRGHKSWRHCPICSILIFTTALWDWHHCLHLRNKKTKAQSNQISQAQQGISDLQMSVVITQGCSKMPFLGGLSLPLKGVHTCLHPPGHFLCNYPAPCFQSSHHYVTICVYLFLFLFRFCLPTTKYKFIKQTKQMNTLKPWLSGSLCSQHSAWCLIVTQQMFTEQFR